MSDNNVNVFEDKFLKEDNQLQMLDISFLEDNPDNFYDLSNIDELAEMIFSSNYIEPLIVHNREDNGNFVIISGHRRKAAVEKLITEGRRTDRQIPCAVRKNKSRSFEQETGEIITFDGLEMNRIYIALANKGQRERTVEEKAKEIAILEPFFKAIYYSKNFGSRGEFRDYFGKQVGISGRYINKLKEFNNLSQDTKDAVKNGTISESVALEMTSFSDEEQKDYLSDVKAGRVRGTSSADVQRKKKEEKNSSTGLETLVNDVKKFDGGAEFTSEVNEAFEEAGVSITEEDKKFHLSDLKQGVKVATTDRAIYSLFIQNIKDPVLQKAFEDMKPAPRDPTFAVNMQKSAQEWFFEENLKFRRMLYEQARHEAEVCSDETQEDKAQRAYWKIRAAISLSGYVAWDKKYTMIPLLPD